jgi:hypothetical protein
MNALYDSLGFLYVESVLYMSVFVECACFGFLLNWFSFFIFVKGARRFTLSPIYVYLKILTCTSLLANLLQVIFAIGLSRRLLFLGNSIYWQYFFAYVYSPLHSTLTFFKFAMDAVVILDRIATINTRLRGLCMSRSPLFNSAVALIVTIVIISPQYVLYVPYKCLVLSEETQTTTELYITDTSTFARTPHGNWLMNVATIFGSVTLCVVDLVLNMASFCMFKSYFVHKDHLTNNVRMQVIAQQQGLLPVPEGEQGEEDKITDDVSSTPRTSSDKPAHSRSSERSLTKMCIVMCTVSVVHQIVHVTNTFVVMMVGGGGKAVFSIFVSNFVSVLRHSSNFFLFYSFNKNFKKEVKNYFNKR